MQRLFLLMPHLLMLLPTSHLSLLSQLQLRLFLWPQSGFLHLHPLEKNKGVVVIFSDDDENSVESPALKRRKTTMVATSHSSSDRRPASLRDNPPSASSPPNFLALEEGVEIVPEPTPAPAPELSLVLPQILRGYQQETLGNFADEAMPESMALSLGGFFTHAC